MDDDWDDISDESPVREKKMSPKRRFRALVRLVIANYGWLVDASDAKYGKKMYTLKKTMKSNLSLEHKAILNKAPEYRTQEENQQIYKIIGGFKCFRKYPDNVKMMLASYSNFCYFGPDRVIVREHHYATAIFFIISGEVNIIEEKHDVFLNETERIVTETLTSGDVFGELCLLHNLPRMETIVSSTPVEFLILKRDDFDIVLKSTVKEEWDYISSLMQSFDYFKDWDKIRIGECCMQSFIKHYKKDDTVLGDGYGRKNYVYFVIKGNCVLIEHLKVEEVILESGKTKYRIYNPSFTSVSFENKRSVTRQSNQEGSEGSLEMIRGKSSYRKSNIVDDSIRLQKSNDMSLNYFQRNTQDILSIRGTPNTVQTIYMQVCRFSEKSCFSLGESMTNRRIVAEEQLLCLLIPAFLLVGRDNIWLRIKQFLTKRIPTPDVVFDSFVRQRKWRQYKTDLVSPTLSSYCTNWYCNIPYSIRIKSDFMYKGKSTDPKTREEINSPQK